MGRKRKVLLSCNELLREPTSAAPRSERQEEIARQSRIHISAPRGTSSYSHDAIVHKGTFALWTQRSGRFITNSLYNRRRHSERSLSKKVDREWLCNGTNSIRMVIPREQAPEFQMPRSLYQSLLRRGNHLIDLRRLISLWQNVFPGDAIDPSIAPMISEDDENALPDKSSEFCMISQAGVPARSAHGGICRRGIAGS